MNLSHLNEAQREAVRQTEGPVMILAGAGSGKTRTLVSRVQYLLEEKKVSPFRILAVTFSNKAAREMRERIAQNSQVDFGAIQVTTFHSFCAKVLRQEAKYLGLSRNFTIYDTSESKSIAKAILARRGISQKEVSPFEILQYIDELKNLGFYLGCKDQETLDSFEMDDYFYEFFEEFESELHKSNAVDFGGLITGVLNLLENFPEVLERYQKRFHYILVDEYQDTNRAQFRLVKLLSEKKKNICVVGDEDQSIYSWRGADIRNILDFEKIFPDAKLIKLEQNYRSSKNIIEAASCVIAKNQHRKGKEMWTDNEQGEFIDLIECNDDKSEAEFVAKEVYRLTSQGVDPKEIAVFYRTNAQSRTIEDALRRLKIPYKVVAGIKFYERKEVKDLLAYMRCVVNDMDSLALSRIINTPTRGIGARTLRKLEDEAIKLDLSLWELINKTVDFPDDFKHLRLSSKVKSGLREFTHLIHEAKALEEQKKSPLDIYEKLRSESGYMEALRVEKSYESQGRMENLDELSSAISQYVSDESQASLVGFLESITLDTSGGDSEEPLSEVSLMTIHGSKGLEYYYVFVVGIEDTVFPSFQSMDGDEASMEEERRLFYVAMTRAMKKLYLCYAQGRMLWGSLRFNPPSRFIDEIPDDFYKVKPYRVKKKALESSKRKKYADFDDSDEFNQLNQFDDDVAEVSYVSSAPKVTSKYPVGSKIKHKLYGTGEVLEVDGFGVDEKVVIKFHDGARKKFLVKFAPIERV
jgi:DNA helicase-2/ATP-dependent DNA helicase PcrA